MVKELKVVRIKNPEEEIENRKRLKFISNIFLYTTIIIILIESGERLV